MVVRRTPGKKIRIVHEGSRDVLELVVVRVSNRAILQVRLDYNHSDYEASWNEKIGDWVEMSPITTDEILLSRSSEVGILHRSEDRMEIQVVDISHKDANIRLVDPDHLFRFEWSDRFLATCKTV